MLVKKEVGGLIELQFDNCLLVEEIASRERERRGERVEMGAEKEWRENVFFFEEFFEFAKFEKINNGLWESLVRLN